MSVSLQQPQTDEVIALRSYFSSGKRLYYICDYLTETNHILIEDCGTNKSSWWKMEDFLKIKKNVIELGRR